MVPVMISAVRVLVHHKPLLILELKIVFSVGEYQRQLGTMHSVVLELKIVQCEINGKPFEKVISDTQGFEYPIIHLPVGEILTIFAILIQVQFVV
jgi:hypothetical protein